MKKYALYRKYRPNTFDDVVGQEATVKTLQTALKNNVTSHAYLLCGPRGTGKTTIAKLVAKTVNCEKFPIGNMCGVCEACKQMANRQVQDIIEIDAASNNGVDEIREIRSKATFLPNSYKYKIYIVDEVHMLTTGAFNALLKTLEEPPSHVIFILATTEPHKIPATIISRCQRFDLKRIIDIKIIEKLKSIAKAEKISIDSESLKAIALLSDGSLRDGISMLDQLASYSDNKIVVEDVYILNGIVGRKEMLELMNNINQKNIKQTLLLIDNFNDNGKDLVKLTENLILFLRDLLLIKMVPNYTDEEYLENVNFKKSFIYKSVDEFSAVINKMKSSNYPKLLLELSLLKLMDDTSANEEIKELKTVVIKPNVEEKINEQKLIKVSEDSKKEFFNDLEVENIDAEEIEKLKKIRVNNALALATKASLDQLKNRWGELSSYSVDPFLGPITGLLLDGTLRVASKKNIVISYLYLSMAERLNVSLKKVEKILLDLIGEEYKVIAVTDDEWLEIKKEYIKKTKKKEKYRILEENVFKIKKIKKSKSKEKQVIKEAIDLFGENLIEIK